MARCAAKDGKASVFFEKATGTKAIKLAVATWTLERVEGERMPREQQLAAQGGPYQCA